MRSDRLVAIALMGWVLSGCGKVEVPEFPAYSDQQREMNCQMRRGGLQNAVDNGHEQALVSKFTAFL